MKFRELAVVLCGMLPCVVLCASDGGDGKVASAGAFPKEIMRLDETNTEYFVSMTLLRQRAMEDAEVLARLAWEKQIVYSNINEKLVKDYKILARQQYVWDEEDCTIYQLLEEKTWRGEPKRLKHLKFKTAEEAKPALELLQKRIRAALQVQATEGLAAERSNLAREADQALRQRFKLDDRGNYTFDMEKRAIVQTGVKEQKK